MRFINIILSSLHLSAQLKSDYREKYEHLQVLNAELRYCKQYVEQSREKLLTEFHAWYRQSFLGDDGGNEDGPLEYPNERFDRLQAALLREDPATTAFYNAQLRTERRVRNYNACPASSIYMYMYCIRYDLCVLCLCAGV